MVTADTRPASPAARYALMGATLLLVLGGLVMIYSASSASDYAKFADSAYHLKRQAVFVLLGGVLLFVAMRTGAETLRRVGTGILVVSDVLLGVVLVMGLEKWGATRWIDLGFYTLQPSEWAKLGVALSLAALLADRAKRPRPLLEDAKALGWIVLPPVALVLLQPDMGTAMSILLAVFLMLMLGGVPAGWLTGVAGAGAVAVPVMIFAQKYRAARFLAFLDPWADPRGDGYQIIQALLAFGSGGLTGVGLGLSRQKFFYLPAAHTDFIFAIIGEELGLVGTLAVVAAFGVIAWAGVRIALAARDPFQRLVAGGLTVTVVIQAIMNMAAVTGLMPVTGIPLPLVSYGGNSVLFTLVCIGLILSVARNGRARGGARSTSRTEPAEEAIVANPGQRRRNGRPRLSGIDGGRALPRRRA